MMLTVLVLFVNLKIIAKIQKIDSDLKIQKIIMIGKNKIDVALLNEICYIPIRRGVYMRDFTAHIRETEHGTVRQTVQQHCINVAVRSERHGTAFSAPFLARLQGMFHDAGKLCELFDDYINKRNEMPKGSIDHCYAGAKYLMQYAKRSGDRNVREAMEVIAHAILSHHGLHDWIKGDGEDYFLYRIGITDRYAEIEKNIMELFPEDQISKLIDSAAKEYVQLRKKIVVIADRDTDKIAYYYGMLERLFESVLVDADRTDTANFQWDTETENLTTFDQWEEAYRRIEKLSDAFQEKKDSLSRLRCDISERCKRFADHEVGICRMIVPTGGGKTLSSLRFAIHYCKKYQKERIFYIAPYMSILEQNSDVWKEIVGEDNFLEHHSNIVSNIETDGELNEYELRTEKWDVPVIATTLVQFLNTFFSGKMDSVRRMHRLCNSVIIIDEVQSVPVKCVNLFNLAMNFISKIGNSSVVLCSATQPVFEKVPCPLLLDKENSSMTGAYEADFLALKRNCLVPELNVKGYSFDEAALYCMEKYKKNGQVLFVVNTKKAAIELYERLESLIKDSGNIVHLSRNLCPERRRLKITKMKELLLLGERLICVTTQLIEAGVDLSFPCVIRSLAGLDNAAQAAGRCNRNGEWEKCCEVYIINLREKDVDRLKDIRMAQNITGQMIRNKSYKDLMSVQALTAYFEKYYQERKDELSYNVDDNRVKTDLIDLLSLNQRRWNSRRNRQGSSPWHAQAFETAGHLFQVIDSKTVSVIVPDNEESRALIQTLRSEQLSWEQVGCLRKAQKYIIEIYAETEKKLLEIHALEKLPCGIYALQEAYYDPDVGILSESKPMELLMI